MDQDAKKNRDKEKRKLRQKSEKVDKLCSTKKYQECLDYIATIDGNAMRNFNIYESAIYCNVQTQKYEDALTLIQHHNDHGHSKKSFKMLFNEAYCNLHLSNLVEAYYMFRDLLGHEDISNEVREYCTDTMERILKSDPKIEASINQIAVQNAAELMHGIEAMHIIEADKPSSSSTSKVDPPVVVVESSSIACSSTTVTSSSQKKPLVVTENMLFEMNELDEQSYDCLMQIGRQTFQKTSIIQQNETCLDESKAPFEMKGGMFLLNYEFLVNSPSLQRNLYVVEPVLPIQVFFRRKLADFSGDNEEKWWEFIRECFQTIFRGIICGLFAIHSANMTCGDLDSSMYVTKDGRGRIFYVSGELFSKSRAQKDLDDLLSTMVAVVTLINPRTRTDRESWLKEFVDSYKLPSELYHFFTSLRDKKVADHMIQTTWLIDHPFFWPFEYRSHFIRILNDVFREGLIDEHAFTDYFVDSTDIKGWRSIVSNDKLLDAIYLYKDDDSYGFGSEVHIIHFILAVLNHANDHKYNRHRGQNKLTPVNIAQRINSVCPKIYTIIYDAMCFYANDLQGTRSTAQLELLSQALERCSSL